MFLMAMGFPMFYVNEATAVLTPFGLCCPINFNHDLGSFGRSETASGQTDRQSPQAKNPIA